MIELKNIRKTYMLGGETVNAVDGLSLVIDEHADVFSQKKSALFKGKRHKILTAEINFACVYPCGFRKKAGNSQCGHCLAAPRLSDDAEYLPAADTE